MAVIPVTVNAAIPSQTVTGDGTLTGTAISSAITSAKAYLPQLRIEKLLPDSAHDAYAEIGRRQAPLYENVVLPPLRHHDVTAS